MPTVRSRAPRVSTIRAIAPRIGAERHADADLVLLLGDGRGHHAVDADERERESDDGEDRQQDQVELRRGVLVLLQEHVQRLDFVHGLVRIDRVDLTDDGAREAGRIAWVYESR